MPIYLTVQVATVWALKHAGRADRIVETDEALAKLLQGHMRHAWAIRHSSQHDQQVVFCSNKVMMVFISCETASSICQEGDGRGGFS